VAVEYGPRRKRFEVADPEVIRRRVNLINSFPVLLFIQARRVAEQPVLAITPQQSDYLAMWAKNAAVERNQAPGLPERFKRALVERTPRLARFLEAFKYSSFNRGFSFRDREAYKRLR
jgi:hypothetical protein